MFYYITFFVLALVALLEMVTVPQRAKKAIYTIISLFFITIASLRWNTGTDWRPYYNFFTKFTIDNPFFLLAMEPGYAQFVKILRLFSSNFTFYLTVLSVLTIGIKTLFFYEYAGAVFIALILYWGINIADLSAVRQSLAIAICVGSTHFIVIKKPWLFLLFALLAAQIHVTAYIYLFAYPVYHAEWSVPYKYLFLAVAVAFGAMGVSMTILEIILNTTPTGIGLDRISEKAQNYIEVGNEFTFGAQVSKTQRLAAALTKRAVLLPIFFYFQEKFITSKETYKGFLNLYTFGNILFFFVVDFLTLQRAASYFYVFEILLFSILFVNVRSKSFWIALIILYALFKLISVIMNTPDLLIPYIWIFSSNTYRYVY